MGAKGKATDNRILDRAEKLFAERGFSAVTMKDICIAASISRGGLYRHFSSTADIFTAIINREQENALEALNRAKEGEVSADKILEVYLKHRMSRILDVDFGIDNAIGEFAANTPCGKEVAAGRAEDCIKIVEELIRTGNSTEVFDCKDVEATARQICWIIEGMNKHSAISSISKEDVENQLKLIENMLK